MKNSEIKNQALRLPEAERFALAEELWASIEDPNVHVQETSLPKWQQNVLDQRLKEAENDPGIPWEQVKAKVWPGHS